MDYILKLAYSYKLQHQTEVIKLIARNADELMTFVSTFPILISDEFIVPISDNFDLSSYDIPQDLIFEFKLTQKAVNYIKNQI